MKIRIANRGDMQTVAGILVLNGYTVRVVKIKDKGRVTSYLEAVVPEGETASPTDKQDLQARK